MSNINSSSDDRCAWLIDAFTDTRYVASLRPDEYPERRQVTTRVRSGKAELTDHFPTEFYGTYELGKVLPELRTPPPLFRVEGGLPIVTEAFADILRRFDLGLTELRPVELFKKDRKKRVFDGQFFGLLPGEHRATLIPEQSEHLISSMPGRYHTDSPFGDNSAAISVAALDRSDLWMEDHLGAGMMVSDRLGQALIDVGWKDIMRLFRCRIVDTGDGA